MENEDKEHIPSDIPPEYRDVMEQKRKEYEKTTLGFWGSWIKRNWKIIFGAIGGVALIVILITFEQLLILFALAVFGVTSGFAWFFWKTIMYVPKIAVAEVQNKDRRSNLYLIPKNLFPNFEIVGTPHFLKDVDSEKEVLVADFVDLDQGFIKCAYDFDVSNLSLSYSREAIKTSEERSVDIIAENHALNDEVDRELLAEIQKTRQKEGAT